MSKNQNAFHFAVASIFIVILLTFAALFLTDTFVDRGGTLSDTCYDGSTIRDDALCARFLRSVYQNKRTLTTIRANAWRIFNVVDNDDVIAGRKDFLFSVWDAEHAYDYLRDYMGEESFTEEEMAAIRTALEARRNSYATRGAEYLLVVIPNVQTVYSECMPFYLGSISEQTRLATLQRYLRENGLACMLDLTDALRAHKSDGLLYNNTENSLNALGLYYAYLSVYQRFAPEIQKLCVPVAREGLIFLQHMTEGRTAARRAGIEDVVQNHTVSLSNDTVLHYRYIYNSSRVVKTIVAPLHANNTVSLLLQFTSNRDRPQIEPFFSNTFGKMVYQTDLDDDPSIFETSQPDVVIQFLYENELSDLLLPAFTHAESDTTYGERNPTS